MTISGEYIECTECGKYSHASLIACWLCNARLDPARLGKRTVRASKAKPASDNISAMVVGSVAVLLLVVGLIANNAWGLAIVLIVLLMPATIATYSRTVQRSVGDKSMIGGQKLRAVVSSFIVSVGCMIIIFVAAGITFFATCFAGFLGGGRLVVAAAGAKSAAPITWAFGAAVPVGAIAGLFVAYRLIRHFWWRRG